MKLSLFSVVLLALSSVQMTAGAPSTVHDEDTFKKRNNIDHFSEVAVRATSDVDAVQFGPWAAAGAALVFLADVAATAIGNLVSNWIQKQIDAGNHQANQYYVIQDTTSQTYFQVMSALGDNLGNQLPDYEILVIEAGAIDSTSFSDPSNVWWMPAQAQSANGILNLDVILGKSQTGQVTFPAHHQDGTSTLFYTVRVGSTAISSDSQGFPAEYAASF